MAQRIDNEAIRQSFGVYLLLNERYAPGEGPEIPNPLMESDLTIKKLGDAPEWWTPLQRFLNDDPTQQSLGWVYYPTQLLESRFPQAVERRRAERRKG